MFKITPVNDPKEASFAASLCKIEYIPECFMYKMFDIESGELLGISQFDIKEGHGIIKNFAFANGCSDFEAMFILARQTMNFINACGTEELYAETDSSDERLLHAVGFKKIEEGYFVNTHGMFDGKCDGHAVKPI